MSRGPHSSKPRREFEDVHVVDVAEGGLCMGRLPSGEVVLVRGAVPGDVVNGIEVGKQKRLKVMQPTMFTSHSSNRAMPVCQHFGQCGGCTRQNIAYSHQMALKEKKVADTLTRLGGVAGAAFLPILPSPKKFYYRNRLDYAFGAQRWVQKTDDLDTLGQLPGAGFHVQGRFDKVLHLNRCHLMEEPANRLRLWLFNWAIENGVSMWHAREHTGILRSLVIRQTTLGDLMVQVIYGRHFEELKALTDAMLQEFPAITSMFTILNPKPNDSIWDLEMDLVFGKSYITETLNGINFQYGPKSFFQTNPAGAAMLVQRAIDIAEIKADWKVVDLYCGVGAFTLHAARLAQFAVGVETVPEAVEFANLNAAANGYSNAKFIASETDKALHDAFQLAGDVNLLITDPPRNGMDVGTIQKTMALAPPKILYVSCNPATQARDIALLAEKYSVEVAQPVDMFPQTDHVENIALLKRRDY